MTQNIQLFGPHEGFLTNQWIITGNKAFSLYIKLGELYIACTDNQALDIERKFYKSCVQTTKRKNMFETMDLGMKIKKRSTCHSDCFSHTYREMNVGDITRNVAILNVFFFSRSLTP